MATYYVRLTGSDAAAGTSAAAAWLTMTKALGAAGISSGDILHVGGGVHRFANFDVAMVSPTAATQIIGDPLGTQTGDAGMVVFSPYTSGDTSAPAATSYVMRLNGRDYLEFGKILFVGGSNTTSGSCVQVDSLTNTSTNCLFWDCAFAGGDTSARQLVSYGIVFGISASSTFQRCIFMGGGSAGALRITGALGTGADYDVGITIKDCVFHSAVSVYCNTEATGANAPGGVDVLNSTCTGSGLQTASAWATSIPSTIYNSYVYASGVAVGLTAAVSGQINENWNIICSVSPRSNVTAGANSISNGTIAPMFEFGQSELFGMNPRPWGMPFASSPLNTFGDNDGASATDLYGTTRSGTTCGAIEYEAFVDGSTARGLSGSLAG